MGGMHKAALSTRPLPAHLAACFAAITLGMAWWSGSRSPDSESELGRIPGEMKSFFCFHTFAPAPWSEGGGQETEEAMRLKALVRHGTCAKGCTGP